MKSSVLRVLLAFFLSQSWVGIAACACPSQKNLLPRGVLAPVPSSLDARLVVFPFNKNASYAIYARIGTITNITLSPGEQVHGLYMSDSLRWISSVTPDRQDIFVKPTEADLFNPATLITNQHKYQLLFISVEQRCKWYQRVSWSGSDRLSALAPSMSGDHPHQTGGALSDRFRKKHFSLTDEYSRGLLDAVNPLALNFRYIVKGHAPFAPDLVFDNGEKTWLRMPEHVTSLPVLFAVDTKYHASLVNYSVVGRYYVVSRLASHWLLKLGTVSVKVVRIVQCPLFDWSCLHNTPRM